MIGTFTSSHQQQLNTLQAVQSQFELQHSSTLQQLSQLVDQQHGTWSQTLDQSKAAVNSSSAVLKTSAAELNRTATQYLQAELKDDLPTGTTPVKKTVPYPKEIYALPVRYTAQLLFYLVWRTLRVFPACIYSLTVCWFSSLCTITGARRRVGEVPVRCSYSQLCR